MLLIGARRFVSGAESPTHPDASGLASFGARCGICAMTKGQVKPDLSDLTPDFERHKNLEDLFDSYDGFPVETRIVLCCGTRFVGVKQAKVYL